MSEEGLNVDSYSIGSDEEYNSSIQLTLQQREREEMEFFIDLAVQEMQRWIEAVTRKRFRYPDNPKTSLADGVQLCQLLNCIVPGSVKRINKLPTAMAGIDNLNVFINTCKTVFHLKQAQLFSPFDLQDKLNSDSDRDESIPPDQIKERNDRKLRDVAITIFWLARQVQGVYEGPQLDFTNFTALVNAKSLNSTSTRSALFDELNDTRSSSIHSRESSRDSLDNELKESSMKDEYKTYRQRVLSSSSFDSTEALEHHGRTHSNSSSTGRRTSSSALVDPLQFIASKPAAHLAHKAREQLELAKETKKTRVHSERDDAEWQSEYFEDLSSWKNLRKRKSSAGITLGREANQLYDPNEPVDVNAGRFSGRRHTDGELMKHTNDVGGDDVIVFKTVQTTELEPQSTNEFLPVIESRESSVVHEVTSLSQTAPPEFQTPDTNTSTDTGLGADNSKLLDKGLSVDNSSEGSESEDDDPLIKLLERAKIETDEQREQRVEMGISNKRLTMTAAPTSDESYGFVIKGGKDKCCPITVDTVALDSISEKSGLKEGDEIIEINKEVVTDRNRGYCMLLINGSLQSDGVLELYIKRDNSVQKDAALTTKDSGMNSTGGKRSMKSTNSTTEVKSLFAHYTKPDQPDVGKNSKMKSNDKDDLDDQIAMERHYRSILDGGYESGVSTLKSDDVRNYRQLHVESADTPSMGSIENSSSQDLVSPSADPLSESSDTVQTEAIEHRVSRDFDEVFAQPKKNTLRVEKRSIKLNEGFNERMREWQEEQDRLHQIDKPAELEKNQKIFAAQINEYRTEAEKKERNRVEQIPVEVEEEEMNTETVNGLKDLGKVHEKEVREKAINRLKEIQERYSNERDNDNNNVTSVDKHGTITPEIIQVHRVETTQHNPPSAFTDNHGYKEPETSSRHQNYELTERERLLREKEEEIRRMTAQLQLEQKKLAEEQKRVKEAAAQPSPQEPVKTTPHINDVYRYYDDDLPSNLGIRDPSPPPMSRQEVLKMNKQTVPVVTATRQNAVREPSPEPVKVTMRNKESSSVAPWQRAKNNKHLEDRRKSAPARPVNCDDRTPEIENRQSSNRTSSSDIDPTLPSTLSKDDVLKMTREKARYGGGVRRKSAVAPSASPVKEEPAVKSTKGFFSNRAMFEQQAQQAEREWEKRQVELNKPKKPFPKQFTMHAEKRAPQLLRDNRSKSVDVKSFRPPAKTDGVVRGQDVNSAANERMRELQMMKNLREEEVRKAEQDERERRLAEKKIREDRQRELAAIRQMNREYELQNQTEQPDYRDDRSGPAALDDARRRMAREAEELAKHQMRHDRENREIHGRQSDFRHQGDSSSSSGEENSTTVQREMEQIEKLGFADNSKYKRHQEMIEQKQREEVRRAELDRVRSQPHQNSRPVTRQPLNEPVRQSAPIHPIHQQSAEVNSKQYDQPSYNNYNPAMRHPPHAYQQPPRGFEDKPSSPTVTGPAPWERDHRQTAVVKNGPTYSPYSDRSSKLSPHSNAGSYTHHHQSSTQSTHSDFSETERLNSYSPKPVGQSQPSHHINQSQRRFSPVHQSHPPHINHSEPPYQTERGFIPNKDSYLQSQSISNGDRVYTPPLQKTPENTPIKPPRNENPEDEPVTVSAKYTCTYCNKELGKGAAMIIESLSLYYHIECFRCCVCTTLLSDGQMGADVRVRGNRLHCKNCYSNEDVGIKYSAV